MAKATKKFTYTLNGGPYDGTNCLLTTPNTIVFTAKGMTGRYRPGKVQYPSRLMGAEPKLIPVDFQDFVGIDLIWEKHDA